jgi:hypothetical protein
MPGHLPLKSCAIIRDLVAREREKTYRGINSGYAMRR